MPRCWSLAWRCKELTAADWRCSTIKSWATCRRNPGCRRCTRWRNVCTPRRRDGGNRTSPACSPRCNSDTANARWSSFCPTWSTQKRRSASERHWLDWRSGMSCSSPRCKRRCSTRSRGLRRANRSISPARQSRFNCSASVSKRCTPFAAAACMCSTWLRRNCWCRSSISSSRCGKRV